MRSAAILPDTPGPAAVLDTTAPLASLAQAEMLVHARYGLSCRAEPLSSERDQHFRIVAADGRTYVFRIANAAEDPATTSLQTAALIHIAQHDQDLPTPRVVTAASGEADVSVQLNGSVHLARLLTYVEGVPFHQLALLPNHRRRLGATLARLGLALRGFSHPAADHFLLWDLKQAAGLRTHVEAIADPACRKAAMTVLDCFTAEILPQLPAFRMQAIHNDFNPHNVLVDAADPGHVTGILDFGDLVRTHLVNDVAVGAAYQVDAKRDPLQGEGDFVSGFHQAVPLLAEELDILPDLIKLRHVLTIAITEWRARRYPGNAAYILRNHARAAGALMALDAVSRATGTERLAPCLRALDARGGDR